MQWVNFLVLRHTTGGPILRSYLCGVRQLLGHRLGTLVDHMSRESPAIEVDRSLSGRRVVAVLERLAAAPELPKPPLVDHGPEFTAKAADHSLDQSYRNSLHQHNRSAKSWVIAFLCLSSSHSPCWLVFAV
jgi:hypothetical protein